jgi:isocitrate lyase
MSTHQSATELKREWTQNPRWQGVERAYAPEDVLRLRGTLPIEYSLARHGAEKLWKRLTTDDYVNALDPGSAYRRTWCSSFDQRCRRT